MKTLPAAALGLALALPSLGLAKPPFLKVFVDAYKISPNSPLGKARCLACHAAPAPPGLNSYGLAVHSAMESAHSRKLTAEILKRAEKADSDGDGAANLAEIRAGNLPGDKKSKPTRGKGGPSALVGLALVPLAALASGRRKSLKRA